MEFPQQSLSGGRILRYRVIERGSAVSYRDAVARWRLDPSFRAAFFGVLAGAPFAAYRWETPPVTAGTFERPFEFVLIDDPYLDRRPEPFVFAAHFARSGPKVAKFANLGGDALLIAPPPCGKTSSYAHLAAFTRSASVEENHALWEAVAEAMEDRVSAAPCWLNTAGDGVAWLHVRLDARPKYYRFGPYKDAPPVNDLAP